MIEMHLKLNCVIVNMKINVSNLSKCEMEGGMML